MRFSSFAFAIKGGVELGYFYLFALSAAERSCSYCEISRSKNSFKFLTFWGAELVEEMPGAASITPA